MPNWCSCELLITGDKDQVKAFKEKAKVARVDDITGTDLSLGQFLPVPDELKEHGWYDWCIKNWGTKWDVDASLNEDTEDQLSYNFESAWSPPTNAFRQIALMYPLLKFTLTYDEPGVGYYGTFIAQDNDAVDNEYEYISYKCNTCGQYFSAGPYQECTECGSKDVKQESEG